MTSILDSVSAVIVGGALLLIVAATALHSQKSVVEQMAFYTSKKHTLEFANMVADEMRLIGAGLLESQRFDMISPPRPVAPPVIPPSPSGGSDDGPEPASVLSVTDTLSFWRSAPGTGTATKIDYVLAAADSVSTAKGLVPLFRVDRFEDGELAGSSPATLMSFRVQLLDDDGNDVGTGVSAAKLVRISFVNAIPFNDDGDFYLRQTHWGLTVRPHNLNL